jgi:hypothetical protein
VRGENKVQRDDKLDLHYFEIDGPSKFDGLGVCGALGMRPLEGPQCAL